MHRLAEIRDEEEFCRARAQRDHARQAFWTARAEQWRQVALDEIAFAFRESPSGVVGSTS
jgi:hypothetical protein